MANFYKNFGKKSDTKFLPDSVVSELGKAIGDEFSYEFDGKLNYYVLKVNGEAKITLDGRIENYEHYQEKIGKKNPSLEEILKYSYNSQKSISFILNDKRHQTINGKTIEVSKFTIESRGNTIDSIDKVYIIPHIMNDKLDIHLGVENDQRFFELERIPLDSYSDICYTTRKESLLSIRLLISYDKEIQIKADINKKLVPSISKYIELYEFIKKLQTESLYINNIKVSDPGSITNEAIESKEKWLLYWKKAKEIEDYLGVHFKTDYVYNQPDWDTIEELHTSLIENRAFKGKRKFQSMTFIDDVGDLHLKFDKIKHDRKKLYLEMPKKYEIMVYSCYFQFYSLLALYNVRVKKVEYDKNTKELIVFFDKAKEGISFSMKVFKNENDLNEFLKLDNHRDIMLR